MFSGAITALVTPFKNGQLDEQAFRDHIDWQIEQGISGLVPCGTTGESATLSHDEHRRVVKLVIDHAKGRVPVLAGTGSNNTLEAIELTRFAKEAGADAALAITPYYNKPTPDGMVLHYKAIAEAVDLPMIVYNVPGRTGINLSPDTVARLAQIKGIVGIKEATGLMPQASAIIAKCPKDFCVLSGDDGTVLPLLSLGAKGVISVVSNVAPADMSNLVKAFNAGDLATAQKLHYKLQDLTDAMFYETNPIPVKTALALMGRMEGDLRLPLCQMAPGNLARLKAELAAYGLIKGDI